VSETESTFQVNEFYENGCQEKSSASDCADWLKVLAVFARPRHLYDVETARPEILTFAKNVERPARARESVCGYRKLRLWNR